MTRIISPREIVGKRIVAFRPNSYVAGQMPELRRTMHQPEIELDDGSVLVFTAEEHPDALEYGVWVGRRMPPKTASPYIDEPCTLCGNNDRVLPDWQHDDQTYVRLCIACRRRIIGEITRRANHAS